MNASVATNSSSLPASAPSSGAEAVAPRRASTEQRLRALDALLDRTVPELQALYEGARTPRLGDVSGDLHGRMLAWPLLAERPRLAGALRRLAGAASFPWKGKSFMPHGETTGEGINRVVSDRFRLFRFETFVGRSKAGDFDAVQLDYDLADNPPVIRSIEDEIRELEPGLWLGQAHLRTSKARTHLWLYFALADTSARPDRRGPSGALTASPPRAP